jgi:predicted esterase
MRHFPHLACGLSSWLAWLAALGLLAGSAACGSDPATTPDAAATADTLSDTTADVTADSTGDAADAGPDTAVWQPPAVAPPDEGTAVAAGAWVVGVVTGTTDGVEDALWDGSFAIPKPGTKAYGFTWVQRKPDAGGTFTLGGNGNLLAWAATTVTVDQPMHLIVRADRAWDVFVNGRRQPGDVYGSGALRSPARLEAGANAVVLRARAGQTLSVGLQTSTHEVYLNGNDRTLPDFRVGDGTERWVGVPALVFGPSATHVTARVVENEWFQASETALPALAGGAVTQVPFLLKPKAMAKDKDQKWTAELRIDAPAWTHSYAHTVEFTTVAPDANFRQTFRSPDDGSVQFYGVRPPLNYGISKEYALVLSLHGAGVDAFGQVGAYSSRDWTWIIAATNRRPFGFDWEEWGRINAIAALDDAQARFLTDPTRTYLVGHSMGGHGTWQVGVHHAGRFALVGPSAGWNSFYSYAGQAKEPTYPFNRARAHSKTTDFIGNLAHRAAFVIHGTADDNVPWSEGQFMLDAVSKVTDDAHHYWKEGGGHWWDGEEAPGADCVDWIPMFDLMQQRKLDLTETDFTFTSAGPWYGASYSYATILSNESPKAHCVLASKVESGKLVLTTTNVRTVRLDGKALRGKGFTQLTVNGETVEVPEAVFVHGPQTGKREHVTGPYNQVFHQPFLFVYPDDDASYADYAAYLVSDWAFIGNGHAGALPASALTPQIRKDYNLIHLGPDAKQLGGADAGPFTWDDTGIQLDDKTFAGAGLLTVFDTGERLAAVVAAPKDKRYLLYWVVPFSSRAGMPDYLVWGDQGMHAAGFYDAEWKFDASLGVGL